MEEPAVARALGAVKPVPRVLEARLVIVRLRKIKKGRIRKRSKKVGCVSDRIYFCRSKVTVLGIDNNCF